MGKRMLARLGAAVAGGALAFTFAAPALGQGPPEGFVQEGDLPITADDSEFEDCTDDRYNDKPANQDGWHFVAPNGSFDSISLTFQTDPDDETATTVESGTPAAPGNFEFQDAAEPNMHATIFTPAGWILVAASAELSGVNFFVLSNTCAGEPDNGETPPPSSPPATDPPGTEPPGTEPPGTDPPGTEPPGKDKELPKTGAQVGALLLLAGGLLAAGIAMIAVRRRRSMNDILEG